MRTIQKQRPTRAAKKTADKHLKRGIRIRVEDLQIHDRIVVRWHAKKRSELSEEEFAEMFEQFLQNGEQSDWVAKSVLVDTITECPGKWRTHIHVNKRECYDIRQFIWIVDDAS